MFDEFSSGPPSGMLKKPAAVSAAGFQGESLFLPVVGFDAAAEEIDESLHVEVVAAV